MCGPDLSNKTRGGALAALNPTTTTAASSTTHLPSQCDFEFYTPGQPSSPSATWARFSSDIAGGGQTPSHHLYMIIQ